MNKKQTYINLNSVELNDLMRYYNRVNNWCKSFDFDSYWLVTDEHQLSLLLYHLPKYHYLRPRLQSAGDLVFKWNRGF